MPEYRVGYYGRGGVGSRQLPFVQYDFSEHDQWGERDFPRVWDDFAGDTTGVVFSIWDASRMGWFANPQPEMAEVDPTLYQVLSKPSFQRWGYFPVDASGVGGKLTSRSCAVLQGYNRVLGYGAWGAQVLGESLGRDVDWIPHGLNDKVWYPRDGRGARIALGVHKNAKLVGCVMSNQTRKDWGLACSVAREMEECQFWFHVDAMVRSERWDLRALIRDFGLGDRVKVTLTGQVSDEDLAYYYSACDLTILPSLGEGFGYPIVESLACGVPVVHGNYGGGVELLPRSEWLVEPSDWRLEGLHCNVRPVYRPEDWVKVCKQVLEEMKDSKVREDVCCGAVEHLHWERLWEGAWRKFFLEGLKNG
jgi:glycosyltransferase involved in cell wall biosynthesis